MHYHNITTDDMKNGEGLRTVLWLAGCNHHCKNCQNPITWDPNGGIEFDEDAFKELFVDLDQEWISGLTLSGGDPLHPANLTTVQWLLKEQREYPNKSVWLYTGSVWEKIVGDPRILEILKLVDVLVDGEYVEELADVNYPWAGSTNQRVIDVQKSLSEGRVILYAEL